MAQPLLYADRTADSDILHSTRPDGAVLIQVRPRGWVKALGAKRPTALIPVLIFAGLCALSPLLLMGYRYVKGYEPEWGLAFLILGTFALVAIVAVGIAVFYLRATFCAELTAARTGLTYWANGPMDPRNKHWPIEQITTVDVGQSVDEEGGVRFYLRVVLNSAEYELLDARPKEELEQVAKLCRLGLGVGGSP